MGRPDPTEVTAVLRRIKNTDDVIVCEPATGPTRYFWSNGSGVFLQVAGKCNYAGSDAVDRYMTMIDWGVPMEWDNLNRDGCMDSEDPRYATQ